MYRFHFPQQFNHSLLSPSCWKRSTCTCTCSNEAIQKKRNLDKGHGDHHCVLSLDHLFLLIVLFILDAEIQLELNSAFVVEHVQMIFISAQHNS